MWEQDSQQKLVPHPVHCRIPLLEVNEGGRDTMSLFTNEHKDCLHDHTGLLASGNERPNPFAGVPRRRGNVRFMLPDEGDQSELYKPEVTQQSTFDESYPTGLTVKWRKNDKVILITMMGPDEGDGATEGDPACKIRLLNSKAEFSVPVFSIFPCSTPGPANIPLTKTDIDCNALDTLITKEDLGKM
eukprot:5985537-Ditylum_brightwellii.AAC.1